MNAQDLRSMEDAALIQELANAENTLVRARFRHSMGRLENTAGIRDLRRSVARVQTEVRRRELERDLAKGSLVAALRASAAAGDASVAPAQFLQGVVDKLEEQQ